MNAQIRKQNNLKKELGKDLGPIKDEINALKVEIDGMKKSIEEKAEVKQDFDKQLDGL